MRPDAKAATEAPGPETPVQVTEVVMCKTGVERHCPDLAPRLAAVGGRLELIECFDKCEQCETFVLSKIDGSFFKCRVGQELVDAVQTLRAPES